MRTKAMTLLLPILLLGIGPGCASNRPVRGWINQAGEGRSIMDFRFVDDEGRARSLRNVLGDYTVLALTRCDKDTHGPATALLEEIVAENSHTDYVKVVGVDIHWAEGGSPHKNQCHLIDERGNLVSLCDATGAIQRLYSADDGEDKMYLIDPSQRIILITSVHDVGSLRRQLKSAVTKLSRAREEQLTREPEDLASGH